MVRRGELRGRARLRPSAHEAADLQVVRACCGLAECEKEENAINFGVVDVRSLLRPHAGRAVHVGSASRLLRPE